MANLEEPPKFSTASSIESASVTGESQPEFPYRPAGTVGVVPFWSAKFLQQTDLVQFPSDPTYRTIALLISARHQDYWKLTIYSRSTCTSLKWMTWKGFFPLEINFLGFLGADFGKCHLRVLTSGGEQSPNSPSHSFVAVWPLVEIERKECATMGPSNLSIPVHTSASSNLIGGPEDDFLVTRLTEVTNIAYL